VGSTIVGGADAELAGRADATVTAALGVAPDAAPVPGPPLAGGRRENSSTAASSTTAAIVTIAARRAPGRFVLVTRSR
jgi:hypothetical protein